MHWLPEKKEEYRILSIENVSQGREGDILSRLLFFHFKKKCEIAIMLMNEGVSDLKDSK